MKIIIANNAHSLELALSKNSATVEAEYGAEVVKGTILTLAHHGDRSARPCPCSIPNFPNLGIDVIGISHVDLDTIGGCMAIMGTKPGRYDWVREFWKVAAEIDVFGPHKMDQLNNGYHAESVANALNAFWAWSESEGRVFPPRDGSAIEVNLSKHFEVLTTILTPKFVPDEDGDTFILDEEGDEVYGRNLWESHERLDLLEKGKIWADAKATLESDSYRSREDNVILRESDQFVNHLYNHEGVVGKAVVAFNRKTGSITVSLAETIQGLNIGQFVQTLWGPEAGGHAVIGGSPRGIQLSYADAQVAAQSLRRQLKDMNQ